MMLGGRAAKTSIDRFTLMDIMVLIITGENRRAQRRKLRSSPATGGDGGARGRGEYE